MALICLLAKGHLLIEDIPGIGKTTMAQALARTLGLDFTRVQFTSDMLPGDILGGSVYSREKGKFVFFRGPVFTQILLSDEINRATPKTQSALLEAMEERQVSLDNKTFQLPLPFFVIATQNPMEQAGTYRLPDSQLDRFLIRLSLGYPHREAERTLLIQGDAKHHAQKLEPMLDAETILSIQNQVEQIHASEALLNYLLDLVHYSRTSPHFHFGLSPRAGLSLLRASQAHAMAFDRTMVLPEDVQAMLPFVAGHRLRLAENGREPGNTQVTELFRAVPVP